MDPDLMVGGRRMAPKPLMLHMAAIWNQWLSAPAAATQMQTAPLAWHPSVAGKLTGLMAQVDDPIAFQEAVSRAAQARLQQAVAGVERYQTHPYKRSLPEPPVFWQSGSTRLLDFQPDGAPRATALFVPSLINPSWILDLREGVSMMRWLRGQGVRAVLLDWGRPGAAEQDFDVNAYAVERVVPAVQALAEDAGAPVILAGYCLGGVLAAPAAFLAPEAVAGLALMAVPWDFQADATRQVEVLNIMRSALAPLIRQLGHVPVDMLAQFFASLDYTLVERKFRAFAAMAEDDPRVEAFVSLEDWNNSGAPLTEAAARQILRDFYDANLPVQRQWEITGTAIDLSQWGGPAFVAAPSGDRIVPPASAYAAGVQMPRSTLIEPPAGHVGMVIGSKAKRHLWRPFLHWMCDLG